MLSPATSQVIPLKHHGLTLGFTAKAPFETFRWGYQPLQRLLLMARVVRACDKLKGGALTVVLRRFKQHGDPQVGRLINGRLVLD